MHVFIVKILLNEDYNMIIMYCNYIQYDYMYAYICYNINV